MDDTQTDNKMVGVSYRMNAKGKKRWRARIKVNGKTIELGTFETKDSAARARRLAEIKYSFTLVKYLQRELDKMNK